MQIRKALLDLLQLMTDEKKEAAQSEQNHTAKKEL